MCGILMYQNERSERKCLLGDYFIEFEGPEANNVDSIATKLASLHVDDVFIKECGYIVKRGPNYSGFKSVNKGKILLLSSVLSLRSPFTKQPIENDRFIIQYNGELYNDEIDASFNDTEFINNKLSQVLKDNVNENAIEEGIFNVIRSLNGEFAYNIIDTVTGKNYFGRDTIGKRSLSYCFIETTKELIVTSCNGSKIDDVYKKNFINCLNNVIYIYDSKSNEIIDTNFIIKSPYKVMEVVMENENEILALEDKLYLMLKESCHKRLVNIHPLGSKPTEKIDVGVLFSGGLDCSLITVLLCEIIIEKSLQDHFTLNLLNVAFENPRTSMQPDDVPDRKLGIKSSSEIIEKFPLVDIKFHKINVESEQYLKYKPIVLDLIYPKDTEMDLSIAIAFFFASKQSSLLNNKSSVLFSGLGADELFGGYHKFNNKSNEELIPELNKQINNIHDRNLNRDDKVIAINGVELRYPFLDEFVVEWSTSSVPLNLKRNKTILRSIARTKLLFRDISLEPKRAIQFGSKSAKMFDSKIKGTDKSS
ncbi:hypothetical protein QEN19_003535 [Hanseniaspora menglaensis]